MFRRLTAAAGVLLAATAIAAPVANAEIAPIDDAPAATLLLPYFEVDLDARAPAADVTFDNVLIGDYQQVPTPAPAADQADDAVAIEHERGDDNRGHGHHGGGHGSERD